MNAVRRSAEIRPAPAPAIAAGAVLCVVFVFALPAGDPARAVAGLVLVLLAPGASLLGALAPGAPTSALERVLWCVGVSIAITILVTLALDAAGVALDLRSWSCTLTALTLAACGVWGIRSRGAERRMHAWHPRRPARGRLALLALAALLCAGAVFVTAHSVQSTNAASHFTQLWILPARAADRSATIGIDNHEGRAQRYVLTVSRPGRVLLRLPRLAVPAGTVWTKRLHLRGRHGRVDVTLQRVDQPRVVYRHVYAWLGSSGSR